MKRKSRQAEEKIGRALSRVDRGGSVQEICEDLDISSTTLYRWLRRYGTSPQARIARLHDLEAEVRQLKDTVNDLTMCSRLLRAVMRRTMPGAARRRLEMKRLRDAYGVSERKACHMLGWPRSTQRYEKRPSEEDGLLIRLKELAVENPECGYRKLWQLLKAEGWSVNHKRVYRLYRDAGLHLQRDGQEVPSRSNGNGSGNGHVSRSKPPASAEPEPDEDEDEGKEPDEESADRRRASA